MAFPNTFVASEETIGEILESFASEVMNDLAEPEQKEVAEEELYEELQQLRRLRKIKLDRPNLVQAAILMTTFKSSRQIAADLDSWNERIQQSYDRFFDEFRRW